MKGAAALFVLLRFALRVAVPRATRGRRRSRLGRDVAALPLDLKLAPSLTALARREPRRGSASKDGCSAAPAHPAPLPGCVGAVSK